MEYQQLINNTLLSISMILLIFFPFFQVIHRSNFCSSSNPILTLFTSFHHNVKFEYFLRFTRNLQNDPQTNFKQKLFLRSAIPTPARFLSNFFTQRLALKNHPWYNDLCGESIYTAPQFNASGYPEVRTNPTGESIMYAAFLAPSLAPAVSTPSRAVRKTLRLATQKPKRSDTNNTSALPEAVDKHLANVEYRNAPEFWVNLEFLDRGYDHDEFGDVDNEYEGLTITDPMDEVELFRFCTGYDVL